jgi:hypothetical protein
MEQPKTAFQLAHEAAAKEMTIASKAGERWAAKNRRDTTLLKVEVNELITLLASVYSEYYLDNTLSEETMLLIEKTLRNVKKDR